MSEAEEIKLTIETFTASCSLPIKCDVERSAYFAEWIVHTWADFPTQQLRRQEVRWPRTWWEHFKLRWFPPWLVRRFPVRYQTRVFDTRLAYPHLALPESHFGQGYPVLIDSTPREEWEQ